MDHILVTRNETTDTWGFQGNPDVYGIGIRLGYYTQALSVWVANFFVPHEARYLHSLNVLFIVAMLVAMIYMSATPSKTYAVEIFLLHQISYTIASVGLTPASKPKWAWNFRNRLARDVVFAALDAYSVWFWCVGLSPGHLKRTPSPEGTVVWWLSQGDLFGWIRVVNMIVVPPLAAINFIVLLNLMGCSVHDRRYEKALASSGYHEIQQDLSKYIRKLKNASFGSAEKQDGLISAPQSAVSPTDDKTSRQNSFSAQSTVVSECNSKTSRLPSLDEKSEKDAIVKEVSGISKSQNNLADQRKGPLRVDTYAHLREIRRSCSSAIFLDRLQEANAFLEEFLTTTRHTRKPCRAAGRGCFVRFLAGFGRFWIFPWRFLYHILRSLPRFVHGLFTHRLRPDVLLPLFNYLHHLPTHRIYKLNTVLPGAWNHPNYLKVDPNLLMLLIKMRLINKPPPPLNKKERIRDAILTLSLCLVLIISVELPLWWNYIRGVQVFGLVGQLIPFCLGVGGLVKVAWAFLDQRSARSRRARNCHCLDNDEDLEEVARLWKDVNDYERRLKGDPEETEEPKGARFETGGLTYWFRVSTGRLRT